MAKILLMTLRLLWVVALVTGALFSFHVALPINVHMYLGFAIAALMIVIGAMGLRAAAVLAVVTILVAISLPVVGIMQLTRTGQPDLPFIQITHVVLGVAAIGLAEVVGKRMRLAAAI